MLGLDDFSPDELAAFLGEGEPDGAGMLGPAAQATAEERAAASPLGVGARNSGTGIVLVGPAGTGTQGPLREILRARLPQSIEAQSNYRVGVASVHVNVTPQGPEPVQELGIRQKLILTVRYTTGQGGGSVDIDATNGCAFTVGGCTSVEIDGRLVAPTDDRIYIPGQDMFVEATVGWNASVSPKPCWMSLPRVTLVAGVESARFPIPNQAHSMLAMSDTPGALAALQARFWFQTTVGAGPMVYAVNDPFTNGTPIAHGVRAVSFFHAATAQVVSPTFELYL